MNKPDTLIVDDFIKAVERMLDNLPSTSVLPGHKLTVTDYSNIFEVREHIDGSKDAVLNSLNL